MWCFAVNAFERVKQNILKLIFQILQMNLNALDLLFKISISFNKESICKVKLQHKTYLVDICQRSHWLKMQSLQIKLFHINLSVKFFMAKCCLLAFTLIKLHLHKLVFLLAIIIIKLAS